MNTLDESAGLLLWCLGQNGHLAYNSNGDLSPTVLMQRGEEPHLIFEADFIALRDAGYLRRSTEGWSTRWYISDAGKAALDAL